MENKNNQINWATWNQIRSFFDAGSTFCTGEIAQLSEKEVEKLNFDMVEIQLTLIKHRKALQAAKDRFNNR